MSWAVASAAVPAGRQVSPPRRRPRLEWVTAEPNRRRLRSDGYRLLPFSEVQGRAAAALETPARSRTLDPLLSFDSWFAEGGRVAVLGVRVRGIRDLGVVTRFVLDPAFRRGCDLLVWADQTPTAAWGTWDDEQFGFSWTADRFGYVFDRFAARRISEGLPPLTPIEERLHAALRSLGLRPRVQYGIDRFRVDFAFPEFRLAVEADGREWHDRARDQRRDAHLQALGWQVVHLTGSEIHWDAARCAAEVAEQLATLQPHAIVDLTPAMEGRLSWWARMRNWLMPKPTIAAEERGTYTVEVGAVGPHTALDKDQRAAVVTSDGVTQVIAPAGSGKTHVLVERVRELLARGVPANRILCTTFNRAARDELRERCDRAGVPSLVDVHTFHSLGRHILSKEAQLPAHQVTFAPGEWRKLAGQVALEPGMVFLDASDASSWVSRFKLVDLAAPEELTSRPLSAIEATARRIYTLYQAELDRRQGWDFDDLIFRSVRLLRDDSAIRQRWQQRWWCVLVDEYQDIEPAQDLLVQTLAAPQDCLFVVGDEDQCIYAWRRASVERIVELDKTYPTLERVVLPRNYRCARSIVTAADQLIRHNDIRFRKQILAARTQPGACTAEQFQTPAREVAATVEWLQQHAGQEAAVLARTAVGLREVAIACLDAGLPIHASERILRPSAAEHAVLAYLSISHEPGRATPDDVVTVFRYPNRYLPEPLASRVLGVLRGGATFEQAIAALPAIEPWRTERLNQAAPLLDALRACVDAPTAMQLLRGDLGLDEHFTSRDQLTPTDNDGRDALDTLTSLATGRSTVELIEQLRTRNARLASAESGDGVELTTIHGAKGREWEHVTLFGADNKVLPHRRALEDADDEDLRARVWEDERRLAYVAYTRAKETLRVTWSGGASPFHVEAGLVAGAPEPMGRPTPHAAARPATSRRQPPTSAPSKVSRPRTTAKFATTCRACGTPIAVGDAIARNGTAWVHVLCADQPPPPPF